MDKRRLVGSTASSSRWMVFAGLALGLAVLLTSYGKASEPVQKIGFVDMTRLFNEYHETKTMDAEFKATLNEEQEKLDRKAEPIIRLRERLASEDDVLSEQERTDLKEQYRQERSKYELEARNTDERLRRKRQELEKGILERLHARIREYGTQEGYSLILRKSMLLHGAPSFDLTDELIDFVNKDSEG